MVPIYFNWEVLMHAVLFSSGRLTQADLLQRLQHNDRLFDQLQETTGGAIQLRWGLDGYGIQLSVVEQLDQIIDQLHSLDGFSYESLGNTSAIVLVEDDLPPNSDDRIFSALVCTYDFLEQEYPESQIFDCRNGRFLDSDSPPPEWVDVFTAANSPDPEDRSTAADELGRINHPAAHALLFHLGNDPDAGVRMMVAIALMVADPAPRGAQELLERLKADPDPDVREQAVSAIECLS